MKKKSSEIAQINSSLENQLNSIQTKLTEVKEHVDRSNFIITPETQYSQPPKPTHRIIGRIKL